jgi:hypothetical protein
VAFYVVPAVLVGVLATLALGVIALSLSLHSIEATLARRREVSALVATGVPVSVLEEANGEECRMVTVPVTVGAAAVGALGYAVVAAGPLALAGGLVMVVVAWCAVRLAVRAATRITRPWLQQAVALDNLRTE